MMTNRKVKMGDRVAVVSDIDLRPYATIPCGEMGTVVRIDEEGNIDVELDHIHPGLAQFRNCIWVCGHSGTDDVRNSLLITTRGEEVKERACKILLQSCSRQQALHSTVSVSLLSLLSSIAA
jgi:hypothetical protein